jgi:hypothetical protein
MRAYVAELAQPKLAKSSDDLPIDVLGDVQLHHAHVRRAEWSILSWVYGDATRDQTRGCGCNSSAGEQGSLST